MLPRKPIAMRRRTGFSKPEPRWAVTVWITGSAMLPVMAPLMSGIERIDAIVTKTVRTPMLTITRTIARGTLRAGSCTSSAMAPAASKPRNVQPMNATAPNQLTQSQLKPLSELNDCVSVSNPWTRKKKNRTIASTTVVVISAKKKRLTKNLRIDWAIALMPRPTSTMKIARMIVVSCDASVTPIPGRMNPAAANAHVVPAKTIVHQYAHAANQPVVAPVCLRVHW